MEEVSFRNKAAVIDALTASGITSVVLAFDGNSDDGQIESVGARAGEITVELPTTQVLMLEESADDEKADDEKAEHGTAVPLAEAIETLCFEYLTQEYRGVGDK